MKSRMARIILAGVGLAAMRLAFQNALAEEAPAAVQIGDSLSEVKRKLGEPRAELEAGNRDVLIYPQGQIVLVNGRVADLAAAAPPPAKPPPARAPTPPPTTTTATPSPSALDKAAHPPDVTFTERVDGEGEISIIAQSDTNTDYTVTYTADLTNMTSSQPLPYTTDSGGQKSFVVLQLKRTDPKQGWKYQGHFDYRVGGLKKGAPDRKAVYLLPYQATETHRIAQGNLGAFSHFAGSQNESAVDFDCPPGTVVCAARAGVVTGIRQDFTEGGTDPKFKPLANYIIIRQDDGTYAEYYHLQHHGALVQLGQHVGAGQHIGLSGATGYAAGPHIHFCVFQNTDGKNRVTVPVKYQTRQGVLDTLKQGETY
ncbi:MAG TPA: M23 family metallopeptidase [Opitutales bacterium]|nr:M23 family metallopeptidase [Opitutales bacterium]